MTQVEEKTFNFQYRDGNARKMLPLRDETRRPSFGVAPYTLK